MRACAFLLVLVAVVRGNFLEDGMEYEFKTESAAGSGTMDHAPHSAGFSYKYHTRIQVSGNMINVHIHDLEFSQHAGGHAAREWPYEKAGFTAVDQEVPPFSIELGPDGLFSKLTYADGLTNFQINLVKGWAHKLQVNMPKINAGEHGFKSKEQLLQGDCDVTYTVTNDMIIKTVSHMKDCENRVYRMLDDWRGHRCQHYHDGMDNTEGLYSSANTVFKFEKKGDRLAVKAIVSHGTVMAQFFETEGVSHFAYTNSTSILMSSKSSPGDISVSGKSTDDLKYEWEDKDYTWEKERDLKAQEPFFGSGKYFEESQDEIQAAVKKGLGAQRSIMHDFNHDKETVAKAHQYGINNILPALYALDYEHLKQLADEFLADTSEEGVERSNVFNELLGSTGTSASALVIRDMVMENKFPNDRDAARILSAVPFHIRRPNAQLLEEYEQLLNINAERFVKMAIPLTFGHLVRITCERAGNHATPAQKKCVDTVAKKYVDRFWDKFQSTTSMEDKGSAMAALNNIRYGGIAEKVHPLIMGETDVKCNQLRGMAIWAAGYDALLHGEGTKYFHPIFADRTLSHELRIYAVSMIFHGHVTATDLNNIMVVLYDEKDYEVINYVFTLLEKYANTINPCLHSTAHLAKYFLKYLRQWSQFETDWGFGVSKTYLREFQKKKYGYGGSYDIYSLGSHKSTTPLVVGFGIGQTLFNSYMNHAFFISLRIQGLAKGLIRKLKTIDPTIWKTGELEKILTSEMGIRAREDQPIHVEVTILIKGVVVFLRHYDENSIKEGGKVKDFLDNLKGLGDTYSINHQRVFQLGSLLYEQPTEIGVPMTYMNSMMTMAHIHATVKKGNHRGLLFRDVKYDIHLMSQGTNIMMVRNPGRKSTYGITQDRIYHAHFPRNFVIGVNPVKKELKLSIGRPAYDDPLMIMMHSQTAVVIRGDNLKGTVDGGKRVIVSLGPDAAKTRVFLDRENQKVGSYLHGEYFDCEMDVSKGHVIAHVVGAFMPYNKNPKTLYNSVAMGIRQIRAFFFYFPRAEKCGSMIRWSQSKNNPVREIEISVRVNFEKNGERLFFRGRKWFIKTLIKAKGEPSDRLYKINFAYEFTPGYLQNNIKLQVQRNGIPGLMEDYSMCASLENKYPDFSEEFLDYDKDNQLEVTGKARVRYGHASDCESTQGEIQLKFKHSTTAEAREAMKEKWYYKKCMEEKNTAAWSGRGSRLPISEACYMTVWDATTARKYNWNVDFVKLTDRMKNIVSQFQSVVKAGLLPYWDIDPETMPVTNPEPHMNLELELKNGDKNVDVYIETSQGGNKFEDIPLRLNWYKRLRNLKFTKTIKRLVEAKILNPCIITSETIRTNDNVTYSYEPNTCWTLTSAHCSPKPTYAIFTKKSTGHPLAVRAYFGGHLVEFLPTGATKFDVKINGESKTITDKEYIHMEDGQEIFKIFKWGHTYNVYSFLKVWVAYDGHFVEVIPAPSVKGQHCGLCGNYNRNKMDEFIGKDETQLASAAEMVENWKWKC